MLYTISFGVKGDDQVPHWAWICSTQVDSFEEAINNFYPGYAYTLKKVWKFPVEASIVFEKRPSHLMTVNLSCDGKLVDEDEVLEAFYHERIRRYLDQEPNYVIPYEQLKSVEGLKETA